MTETQKLARRLHRAFWDGGANNPISGDHWLGSGSTREDLEAVGLDGQFNFMELARFVQSLIDEAHPTRTEKGQK